MNAIQFIQQNSVDKIKKELNKLPNSNVTHMTNDARMFVDANNPLLDEFQRSQIKDLICIDELERLVDSVDFINKFGGIDLAKAYDKEMSTHGFDPFFEKSIADYESIYGGEHV